VVSYARISDVVDLLDQIAAALETAKFANPPCCEDCTREVLHQNAEFIRRQGKRLEQAAEGVNAPGTESVQ